MEKGITRSLIVGIPNGRCLPSGFGMLLNGLQPGDSRTIEQTVAINYLDDPTSRDYSGSLNATYT